MSACEVQCNFNFIIKFQVRSTLSTALLHSYMCARNNILQNIKNNKGKHLFMFYVNDGDTGM